MQHIDRRHSIVLSAPVDRVFPLFTPRGEKHWAAGWDPEFLHPTDGETREGMVFRTTHGGETTLWTCTAWEPAAHLVRYMRVTPDSRVAVVEVRCREAFSGGTEATVSYAITALNKTGQAYLAGLTEEAFARMIDGWQTSIDRWLRHGSGKPH